MLNRYTKSSRKWNWLFWSSRYHGAVCGQDGWERRPQKEINYDTSYQRFCGRNLTGKTPDATARNVNRKHRFPSVWYSQTDIQWDSGQANRLKIWAETSTFSSDFFVCLQEKETGGECASGQEGQHMIGVNKDRRLSHIAKVTWINDHHVMRASLLLNGSKAIAYCSSGFLEAGKRVDTAVRNKIERKFTKNQSPSFTGQETEQE